MYIVSFWRNTWKLEFCTKFKEPIWYLIWVLRPTQGNLYVVYPLFVYPAFDYPALVVVPLYALSLVSMILFFRVLICIRLGLNTIILLFKYYYYLCQDDPIALARFKEVVEAYEVLSSPDEKQKYDNIYGFNAK